jgi:hypothetical protein
MPIKKALLIILMLLIIGIVLATVVLVVIPTITQSTTNSNNNTNTATKSPTSSVTKVVNQSCTFDDRSFTVDTTNLTADRLGRCEQKSAGACNILYPDGSTVWNDPRKVCECKTQGFVTEFGANSEIRCKKSSSTGIATPTKVLSTPNKTQIVQTTTALKTTTVANLTSTITSTGNNTGSNNTLTPAPTGTNGNPSTGGKDTGLPNTGLAEDITFSLSIGMGLIVAAWVVKKFLERPRIKTKATNTTLDKTEE